MGNVTTSLADEAERIFTDLGYEVTENGAELRAERKWRVVQVTTDDPAEVSGTGALRCFVARDEEAPTVRDRLLAGKPDYDWAVIGVDESGDYQVYHPRADVLSAP